MRSDGPTGGGDPSVSERGRKMKVQAEGRKNQRVAKFETEMKIHMGTGNRGSGMTQPWGYPAGVNCWVNTTLFMTLTTSLNNSGYSREAGTPGLTRTRDLTSRSLLKSIA